MGEMEVSESLKVVGSLCFGLYIACRVGLPFIQHRVIETVMVECAQQVVHRVLAHT